MTNTRKDTTMTGTDEANLTAGTTAVRIHLLSCGHVVWVAHPVYGDINHCLSCNRTATVEHYIDEQAIDADPATAAELRETRITQLRAELEALEELARLHGELQALRETSA